MKRTLLIFSVLFIFVPVSLQAGWQDWLKDVIQPEEDAAPAATTTSPAASLSQADMNQALRDALNQGVRKAIEQLGTRGGFLQDAAVRIPMPDQLSWAEKGLRTLKQDALADAFVESMNRAAEQAVPETIDTFSNAIKQMTLQDAQSILQGADDAATRYFREHSSDELLQRLRPIVSQATDAAGVTRYYKQMVDKASYLQPFMSKDAMDLDGYVTQKALDGLFLKLAEQEKLIRENPAQRTTDIMKKVFDYYTR